MGQESMKSADDLLEEYLKTIADVSYKFGLLKQAVYDCKDQCTEVLVRGTYDHRLAKIQEICVDALRKIGEQDE